VRRNRRAGTARRMGGGLAKNEGAAAPCCSPHQLRALAAASIAMGGVWCAVRTASATFAAKFGERSEFEMLQMTFVSESRSRSLIARLDPMNPVPPVISVVCVPWSPPLKKAPKSLAFIAAVAF
jgi:hypothetical protein